MEGHILYFSDWRGIDKKGMLMALDLTTHQVSKVPLSRDISGPADFCISRDRRYFIIPATMEGKILFERR
jgi:hypothetical protein